MEEFIVLSTRRVEQACELAASHGWKTRPVETTMLRPVGLDAEGVECTHPDAPISVFFVRTEGRARALGTRRTDRRGLSRIEVRADDDLVSHVVDDCPVVQELVDSIESRLYGVNGSGAVNGSGGAAA